MERKITNVENSLGITLPQEVLDHLKKCQPSCIQMMDSGI